MSPKKLVSVLLFAGLAGCVNYSDPTKSGPPNPVAYQGVKEDISPAVLKDLLYIADTPTSTITNISFQPGCDGFVVTAAGGSIFYNLGGVSGVYDTGHTAAPIYAPNGLNFQDTQILLTASTLNYPGVGGPNGDFSNCYFLQFKGRKGPNAATDYDGLDINLVAGNQVPADISCYRGFIFFARGNGNWGVQLITPKITAYNYYEDVFGSQLSASSGRNLFNFSDMQQLFGQHVDLYPVPPDHLPAPVPARSPLYSVQSGLRAGHRLHPILPLEGSARHDPQTTH